MAGVTWAAFRPEGVPSRWRPQVPAARGAAGRAVRPRARARTALPSQRRFRPSATPNLKGFLSRLCGELRGAKRAAARLAQRAVARRVVLRRAAAPHAVQEQLRLPVRVVLAP